MYTLADHHHQDTTEFMEVDQLRGQKLKINFDITFPSMSCSVVHLDVMDSGGKHQVRSICWLFFDALHVILITGGCVVAVFACCPPQLDVDHNVRKRRIDLNGNEFGALEENEVGVGQERVSRCVLHPVSMS